MIKIFVGSSSNGEDSDIERVYEQSLYDNASVAIQIIWMRQTNDVNSYWYHKNTRRWSTPFSGYRWMIPQYCNFEGRAIYTDCDMINLHDINELYTIDINDKVIAARTGQRFAGHEFCVMVFDCAKIEQHLIPATRQRKLEDYHHRMISKFSGNSDLVHDIDPRWNSLDGDKSPIDQIKQLHYTNMATQPWTPSWYKGPRSEHPRPELVTLFEDKLKDNTIPIAEVPDPPVVYDIIGQ